MQEITPTGKLESKKHAELINWLRKCVEHHHDIINMHESIKEICFYLSLCMFIANLFNLCFLVCVIFRRGIIDERFFWGLTFCSALMYQLSLYCVYGNNVTLESASVATDAYFAYSPYIGMRTTKSLCQIMVRAQRPLILTAGGFAPLSLSTLVGVRLSNN